VLSLEEAKALVLKGASFTDVEGLVSDQDNAEFRYWFVYSADWKIIEKARRPKHFTGDECPKCGGQMVWRGACKQCSMCGEGGSCG
jgi:predicted RNA-binding Zn-ribbon protein involved in translation (DUF1610 family)